MKTLAGIAILMATAAASVRAGHAPFDPKPAAPYREGTQVPDGMARIRLDLTSNEDVPSSGVGVGAVTFCSITSCFRAAAQHVVDLSNTTAGTSLRVLDAMIPTGKITDVFFGEVVGPKVVAGSFHFRHPIPVDKDFQGTEILVVLDRASARDRTILEPVAAAGTYFRDGGEVIYYNPRFRTVAGIGNLAHLDIPAGATTAPQVFSVAAHDIGEDYPLVDIYPAVDLGKPATVRLDPTPHARPSANAARAPVASLPFPVAAPSDGVPRPSLDIEIPRTGVIQPSALRPALVPDSR
jgi:hypothetical protein